jgi:hypothetical protein
MSNKILKLSPLFVSLLFSTILIAQASAEEWTTGCGRSEQESKQCRHIKSEAILAGLKGTLNTIIFPNGNKLQYFYIGGVVCGLEGLKVRESRKSWFDSSTVCSKRNRLIFKLPSGATLLWINASVD